MTFGISAFIAAKYEPASKEAVTAELIKLLAVLGTPDSGLVTELTNTTIRQDMLFEMALWNRRIAPNGQRDRFGNAAAKFWAAQTLATTVMRPSALDQSIRYSPAAAQAMACGAEGLFEVGRSQFEALGSAANDLVSWIAERGFKSFAIIESPLGNSLPVQVVCDFAHRRGIESVAVEWNAPRNDRPTRGRTIAEASRACVEATNQAPLVILMDDAITGTRFIKLFDAVVDPIGRDRFLVLAMAFEDTFQPEVRKNPNRQRLAKRIKKQGEQIGYPNPLVSFPLQPLFTIDAGPHVRWQTPIMWGDSDLIAGKRKVNLVFTLVDHCLGILQDLGAKKSSFRAYLEQAWQQDTTGATFRFEPGLVRSVFQNIAADLPLEDLQSTLWDKARDRFPDDYKGRPFAFREEGAKERLTWFREAFLAAASERLDEQRAGMAWRAIDDTFAASSSDHKPRSARDDDATPYTFPFNSTISALNLRLREMICTSL